MIRVSVELRRKNSRTGNRSENTEIKNKYKLVCDRNAGYLISAYGTYHYIIKHTDKIGYAVLHHYRYQQHYDFLIKRPVAKE